MSKTPKENITLAMVENNLRALRELNITPEDKSMIHTHDKHAAKTSGSAPEASHT